MEIKRNQSVPLTISFIGAGNLASHLAPALAAAGHQIVSIFSRTLDSAQQLAMKVGQNSAVTTDLNSLKTADLYIISVADSALPTIIAAWPDHCREGIVVHTAGSLPMSLLKPTGNRYGVLYPMQTFSKSKTLDFNAIPCFVEADSEETFSVLFEVASSVSDNVKKLSSDDRRFLHLAAVFACNFSNHMMALAYEMLEQHHVDPACLTPLIDETCAKLHHLHPHDGQTGPARRHDDIVMQKHLDALKENTELHNIYQLISESICRRF